jgi:FlaA1/EpsC-like NDP-sugar epimerase
VLFRDKVLNLPRFVKRIVVLIIDGLLCLVTFWLALYLRLGEFVSINSNYSAAVFLSIGTALPIFIVSGLYRAVFRYSGLPAIMTIGKAIALYGLIFFCLVTVIGVDGTPRTIGIIQPVLLFLGLALTRGLAYIWLGYEYKRRVGISARERVLIYGAGSAGRQIAAALFNHIDIKVVGFLDDNPNLVGRVINGLTVYSPNNLVLQVSKLNVNSVLLAIPSATRRRRYEIIDKISQLSISIRTLPSVIDLAQGNISVNDIKELDLDDLLGREPVPVDPDMIHGAVKGKRVLITGAGGSIGSELARQIIRLHPSELVLLDHSEFALYNINESLVSIYNNLNIGEVKIHPVLASVKDERALSRLFYRYKPETVFHAAAYKHVPLVESNFEEGIYNNIFGTKNVAELALEHNVINFILISTDKAVRPTNVMGATKRWAELIVQDCAVQASNRGSNQKFSAVRFGNVIGSSGSVVPLFREQISKGGPITLTHKDVTRYFMSIEEAVGLVLQAASLSNGGEIFLLDMGKPVKVYDLARSMVRLSGLSVQDVDHPDGDIAIETIGLRPGEKLYEELLIDMESSEMTSHPKIKKAKEPYLSNSELERNLIELSNHLSIRLNDELRHFVMNLANRR